jgi:hypothetical protein
LYPLSLCSGFLYKSNVDPSVSFHRSEDEADEGPRNVVINNSTVRRWKTQKPSAFKVKIGSKFVQVAKNNVCLLMFVGCCIVTNLYDLRICSG